MSSFVDGSVKVKVKGDHDGGIVSAPTAVMEAVITSPHLPRWLGLYKINKAVAYPRPASMELCAIHIDAASVLRTVR
jgi:hypothetical protein